jgi:biotin carboxyl carrier protein
MMTVNDIKNLIELLNEAPELAELSVTATDGSEIVLKRSTSVKRRPVHTFATAEEDYVTDSSQEPAFAELSEASPALSAVAATMVGIFHLAMPPVQPGTVIRAGQRVGSIESMKLMNDVVSTAAGTVVNVLIDDGVPVEYGQVLYQVAAQPIV